MRSYKIRANFGLPMVSSILTGKKQASRFELVFDSGCANTQFHIGALESLGYSFKNKRPDSVLQGVTGIEQEGYSLTLNKLHILGKSFSQIKVFAFDFSEWANSGIDGLLGWDIIQKMDFEVLGKKKIIKVY